MALCCIYKPLPWTLSTVLNAAYHPISMKLYSLGLLNGDLECVVHCMGLKLVFAVQILVQGEKGGCIVAL